MTGDIQALFDKISESRELYIKGTDKLKLEYEKRIEDENRKYEELKLEEADLATKIRKSKPSNKIESDINDLKKKKEELIGRKMNLKKRVADLEEYITNNQGHKKDTDTEAELAIYKSLLPIIFKTVSPDNHISGMIASGSHKTTKFFSYCTTSNDVSSKFWELIASL